MTGYAKCVRSIGQRFLAGNIYEIMGTSRTNGQVKLRADDGRVYWMFVAAGTQFEFCPPPPMGEPMFDLDDMELAKILMDEMK